MILDKKKLRGIYDSTSGHCHLCHKKLAFKNYGILGARAAWEVDHSKPKASGGTDHSNNLKPACQSCNRSKGKRRSRIIRADNGLTRAPRSRAALEVVRKRNGWIGASAGAALGFRVAGPFGLLAGGIVGSILGKSISDGK